jgi:hypothetical protein
MGKQVIAGSFFTIPALDFFLADKSPDGNVICFQTRNLRSYFAADNTSAKIKKRTVNEFEIVFFINCSLKCFNVTGFERIRT